ncbi:MAG: mandelate racemase/muconate lactonizing enzyme family protein [Caldilineaceae bacterium]|nr:mandelate racemase/muconate lactonizing enzyme family protein [Caldilineaceae bacterium]
MKITKLETIWFEAMPKRQWQQQMGLARQALPNNLWVRIHTDTGLVGLGETYYIPAAISAIIHDVYAPLLLGRAATEIENHWANLFALVNFCGFAGAEMRALSAIDIALWDLLGQATGQPIYQLLGGRNRERIPVYNTCVGYGNYPDFAWLEGQAGALAESLLRQGIKAMKIWPFDQFGVTLAGPANPRGKVRIWGGETAAGRVAHSISNEDLRQGLQIVASIRQAVGDKMAIAIEGHARWDLPTATRIARALEPYDILWLEEIMPPDNPEAYVRLKAATTVPLCQSERVFTRYGFRPLIERPAADIIMPDVAWGGGITEIRKICAWADSYYLPVTLHDTVGPVALWASAHLMLHLPNAMIMESVRAYWADGGWYNDVVTRPIAIADGYLSLDAQPGLGIALRPALLARPDARIRVTTEQDIEQY